MGYPPKFKGKTVTTYNSTGKITKIQILDLNTNKVIFEYISKN